jgi:hypothetical protein
MRFAVPAAMIGLCPGGTVTGPTSTICARAKEHCVDASRFDALARAFIQEPSRRGLLSGLGAAAISVSALRRPWSAEAKKKRKKKLKKNEFGCVNVGSKCRGKDSVCCSGICQGKKPKKGKKDKSKCVAHDVASCQPGDDACESGFVGCGGANGGCYVTTGSASFCGIETELICIACQTDSDCVATTGAGSACVVCACGPFTTACAPPGA